MNIVSIDVGILHLGVVCCDVTWEQIEVKNVALIDITKRCRHSNCTLNHTNHIVDRVDHFIQGYKTMLDKADRILIEKQPPVGLISVEQLLFDRLRDKVEFIYPVSVHKHFGIRKLDYDGRKAFLVEKTKQYLTGTIYDTLGKETRRCRCYGDDHVLEKKFRTKSASRIGETGDTVRAFSVSWRHIGHLVLLVFHS